MKRTQRGNELYVAAGFVAFLILAAAGAAWYLQRAEAKAFAAGEVAEASRWQKRELEQQQTYAAEIERIRAEKDQAVGDLEQKLADADRDHQRRLADEKLAHDRFVSDLASGRIVFHIPRSAGAGEAGGSQGADDPAAAGRRDAIAAGELPGDVATFLYGEASRADEVAEQLGYAQSVITAYYELARSCSR